MRRSACTAMPAGPSPAATALIPYALGSCLIPGGGVACGGASPGPAAGQASK
jgi:hypothetical protein